ncbi:MAG: transaldolase, partial [Propionibacteriaceae bacterium]|nr:transaldolase [Propionibacteriaceae bacterium]
VELNNPFEADFSKLLEEAEEFKEMLSEYRVVIKVPHTGPVNSQNVHQLLEGDKRLDVRYDEPATADALRGHNLALKLREHGYRINFTLMFEPWQTALALQAKPAFINAFIRHRAKQSAEIARLIRLYDDTGDDIHLADLRTFLLAGDYLASGETDRPLAECLKIGRDVLAYRHFHDEFGADGLDGLRRDLRWLRQSNLPDTRLIICSMEGEYNYPDIDAVLNDPAYADVIDRVVLTAEPKYLARFTSANQVVSYQRRFMNAAATAK